MAAPDAIAPARFTVDGTSRAATPPRTLDQFVTLRTQSETLEQVLDAFDRLARLVD